MYNNSFVSIHKVIDTLTDNLGIRKRLEEYDALTKWEEAVGKPIASVATPTRILKGVLFVKVKTSTWRNELLMRKKEVIDRINKIAGGNIVKEIKFQ